MSSNAQETRQAFVDIRQAIPRFLLRLPAKMMGANPKDGKMG
jgi:hypothetical protein